jgi:hypothetical protein
VKTRSAQLYNVVHQHATVTLQLKSHWHVKVVAAKYAEKKLGRGWREYAAGVGLFFAHSPGYGRMTKLLPKIAETKMIFIANDNGYSHFKEFSRRGSDTRRGERAACQSKFVGPLPHIRP